MKTIHVTTSLSTGLDASLAGAIRTIGIEDAQLGQGGFGVTHRSSVVNGGASAPRVCKILFETFPGAAQRGFRTIQELQRRLQASNTRLTGSGSSLLGAFPALAGVPQLSFEGTLDGKPVLGYLAADLGHCGMEDFGGVLDDDRKVRQLQSLPLATRLAMAAQLVDAFEHLSTQIQYIHADIKAEALFVDLQAGRCAVIDYDSGAVTRGPNDQPTTFGTRQDWLAPEIMRQLDQAGNTTRTITVTLLSDVWSVNIAIHYLLFGIPPLFFLSEVSERSMKAYLQRYAWPAADPSFAFFRRGFERLQADFQSHFKVAVPKGIADKLAYTINRGFNQPSHRTSYSQWKAVLVSQNRPKINVFIVDRTFIADNRPVKLKWDVSGAIRVSISGLGDVMHAGAIDVPVVRDRTFVLTMTPVHGAPLSESIVVTVSKAAPIIDSFVTSHALLQSRRPARLEWRVRGAESLHIDHGVGDVSTRTAVDVLPRRKTQYTLSATSRFGITVTRQLTVDVNAVAPTIHAFSSDRSMLDNQQEVTLRWKVSADAHEVHLSGVGTVAHDGAMVVRQSSDTVHVLRATGFFGGVTESRVAVSVSKAPPVIETFRVTSMARAGQPIRLDWKTSRAAEVVLDPGSIVLPAAGSAPVTVSANTSFTLTARTCFGVAASRSISVRLVGARPAPIATNTLRPATRLNTATIRRRAAVVPRVATAVKP